MSFMDDFKHLKISLKYIQAATNNFQDKPIGSGGFGAVYKGELVLQKGPRMVAFKRLDRKFGQGDVEFWKEITMLSGLKHKNLATLLHFCNEDEERILVYKYASRGSLDKYLGDSSLTWNQRLDICLGAARGIAYLHDPKKTQQRVLHRDIKSSNILLDDKWTAKVSDFGLSKFGPANQARSYLVSNIAGTPGYCDPLYFETGFLSKESDVYSFGVVLFEVMCGRLCCIYDKEKGIRILVKNWRNCYTEKRLEDIIFPDLKEQINQESLSTFAAIANRCLNRDHRRRPHMVEIVKELETAIHQQVASPSRQVASHPRLPSVMVLEQVDAGVSGTIVVMICRVWDVNAVTGRYLRTDFVVCDARGKAMHCTARSNIAHNFVGLKEGSVYSIKNFIVQPNKNDYRIIRHDPYMLEFDGSTTTRKVSVISDGFVRYPFELADFDDIEPTDNKYLIDVAGYVTNVGRTTHQKTGSRTLDFYLVNKRGQSIRVTLWEGLGDTLIEKKTKNVGLCPIVITSVNAKQYNNKVYLSSSSSTLIYDNPDIPALIELKIEMSSVELNKAIVPVDFSEPKDGTLENLLIWGRNKRNNSMIYKCKVKIENVRTRKGWNYPSCGDNKCRKGTTRKGGKFWCDACEKNVEYPILRFRLELDVSDDTAQTVVVLFDETVRELLKCTPEALLESESEDADGYTNLSRAILDLIGTYHTFELKSHTYFEHGTFESFTCWKISSAPPVGEITCSSSVEPDICSSSPLMKRLSKKTLSKNPNVSTPLKPVEGKNKKRMEFEDSDMESVDVEEAGIKDGSVSDKRKRRKYIQFDSDSEEEASSFKVKQPEEEASSPKVEFTEEVKSDEDPTA